MKLVSAVAAAEPADLDLQLLTEVLAVERVPAEAVAVTVPVRIPCQLLLLVVLL